MAEWFNSDFLGISIGRYATALGIILAAYISKKIFAYLFSRIILPLAQKTSRELDDRFLACLQKPAEFLVFLIGLFIALQVLQLPSEPFDFARLLTSVLKALVILDIAWFLFNLVDMVDHYLSRWAARTESTLDDHLAPLMRKTLRIFIVVMAGLMAIQTFGYPVTGVLASLGIGGLAFALAAKDTVSNIFGSLNSMLNTSCAAYTLPDPGPAQDPGRAPPHVRTRLSPFGHSAAKARALRHRGISPRRYPDES